MVIFAVAHCTEVDALAAIDLAEYLHKLLCEAYHFFVQVIGRFAHIVKMLDGRYAHMTYSARISNEKALDVGILVKKLVGIIAIESAVMLAIKASRANSEINKLGGG